MDAPNSNYAFRLLSMRLPDGTVIETSSATREKQRQEAAERARKSAWGIE